MSSPPLITIFTPTFNRAHTLHRVFDSLQAQTLKDFEWLVIDDGSTDDTSGQSYRFRGRAGLT
jgi:glycosyltransferase involved in cell wall biosynthesis